jgi:hypothetical protein
MRRRRRLLELRGPGATTRGGRSLPRTIAAAATGTTEDGAAEVTAVHGARTGTTTAGSRGGQVSILNFIDLLFGAAQESSDDLLIYTE